MWRDNYQLNYAQNIIQDKWVLLENIYSLSNICHKIPPWFTLINQRIMEQFHDEDIQSSDQETQQVKLYTDPVQYLEWCKADKKIKIMDQMNPLLNNIYLKDISLHKKGPMEDKIYSKRPIYYWNIRRGNTLCEIYENQKRVDLFFCRRGMIKFFDLQPKFLEGDKSHLTYRESLIRKVIFNQLDQKLTEGGYKFHLYSLFKENGEHCQIAYLQKLDAWIFASKNVSIIVRDEDDIEKYQKIRFYWAKLIAVEFLKTVRSMTPQTQMQFKKDIANKTLIGEYCGYEKHQHITKYEKVEIIFYAIVENVSDESCLPVDQAFQLFDKYKLRKVYTESYKNLVNHTQVYEKIYQLTKKMAVGSMDVVGEGSVLYIVAEKDGKQRTISLSKLKSAEYLIFRKLREMLKINLSKKGQTANTISKFKFEVEQIVKQLFNPPYPLDYYYKIAEIAFKQVGDKFQNMGEEELRYRFVAFLDNILSKKEEISNQITQKQEIQSKYKRIILICLPKTFSDDFTKQYKERGIKIQEIFREGVEVQRLTISYLHMVPRVTDTQKHAQNLFLICQYTDAQMEQIVSLLEKEQEPYNQSIISFIKNNDKEKQISLLNNKISAFSKLCQQKRLNYMIIKGANKEQQIKGIINEQFCGKKSQTQKQENAPVRYIIIPFLLPGSGKTFLSNRLKDMKLPIKYIESDEIRRGVYKRLQQQNNNKYTNSQLFQLSKTEVLEQYTTRIKQLLSRKIQKDQLVYIDRIFAPTQLQQLQYLENDQQRFIFLTQSGTGWRNNDAEYPFSVTYLLNCFKRCIERQGHGVLESDAIETIKIVLKFYQMFRGWKSNFLEKKYPRSRVIRLPFVEDDIKDDDELSNTLKNKIRQCLKLITPGYDAPGSIAYNQLVQLYYSSKIPEKNPQPKVLVEKFLSELPIKL